MPLQYFKFEYLPFFVERIFIIVHSTFSALNKWLAGKVTFQK